MGVKEKKIGSLDGPEKHLINGRIGIYCGGWGFGLLPASILGEIGDFLPSASDRYTNNISVPNLYHSLGRGGVQTLREAVRQERAEEWE